MDVSGVLVDDGGTGVVVVWRMSEARGRIILYTARDGGGGASAGVSGACSRCVSKESHLTLEA
jgi:hypothetical protein